jgi:hypothetical protein
MMVGQALVLLMLVGQPASDGDDSAKKAEAGKHLERGNELLRAGDAAGALESYQQAYDAYPSPKIFFNMAEAHRELDNLLEAAALYERVTKEVPADSPLIGNAQEALQKLDRRLGRVSVSSEPSGAYVRVAGRDAGSAPVYDIRVAPGKVEIEATLDGNTKTQSVDVEPGETRAVEIDFSPMIVEPPPPPPPGGEEDESIAGQWWFWTLIGVGVVGAATATALIVTSGDDFVPMGELGYSKLDEWRRL